MKIKDYKDEDTPSVLFLSYFVSTLEADDVNHLDVTYCQTQEKIIFVASANEEGKEWHGMTLALTPKTRNICVTRKMRDRAAKYAIFSAADPRRHKLQWIVIEASFTGNEVQNHKMSETENGKRILSTSSAERRIEVEIKGGVSAGLVERTGNDQKGSERRLESNVEDPGQNKRPLAGNQGRHEDDGIIVCGSQESSYQEMREENRGLSFQDNKWQQKAS